MHYSRVMQLRLLLPALVLLSLPIAAQDLDVDREELRSQSDATIEFENYQGPQDTVSSAEEIRGIGEQLADQLVPAPGSTASYLQRYTIFRGVDPADPVGLDADVLSINENAGVDHIDNVRRILSGYLTQAFA